MVLLGTGRIHDSGMLPGDSHAPIRSCGDLASVVRATMGRIGRAVVLHDYPRRRPGDCFSLLGTRVCCRPV